MTLDSLPDLDTSGLCLVKTLSTALTCWPYRNTALRDGARTSTRTSSVAKWRTASIHCRPAPPRQTEARSSRTSRSRPWKRRSQAVRERKTSVLRPCRVPNPAKRLNVVQRPKTLFEPQRSNDFAKLGTALGGTPTIVERLPSLRSTCFANGDHQAQISLYQLALGLPYAPVDSLDLLKLRLELTTGQPRFLREGPPRARQGLGPPMP